MKSLITLFALLSLTLIAAAQPYTLWTRTFGGSSEDWAYNVQQTTDSGYIIAGVTNSYGAGGQDVYLIKTDANGDSVWTHTFGGIMYDYGSSVRQTSDGGYIIIGKTYSFGALSGDVFLIKSDSTGNLVWQSIFGGGGEDWGHDVLQTSDSGYIIVGITGSYGAGNGDVYLIKTDANGDSVWTRTFGGTYYDSGSSIQQTSDGGYIIAGRTNSYGAGNYDVYLIKTDSGGNLVWQRTFGGSDYDSGHSIQLTPDGGYIIAGTTKSYGAGEEDFYLIKADSTGNSIWQRTFGGSNDDYSYSVQPTSDGGYIISGSTESYSGLYNSDIYLIKTDSTGNQVWQLTCGGSSYEWAANVLQALDGGYVVTGTTQSYGAGIRDVYLIKLAAEGTPVKPWGKPTSPPAQFALLGAFPNPFNPTTTIRFDLPQAAQVRLEVFDVNGRVVGAAPDNRQGRLFHQEMYGAGTHEIVFDGSGLPSGVYLYRLTATPSGSGVGPTTVNGKMVLLK